VTLGLALLAGGAAWTVDLLGVRTVSLAEGLAVVLAVLGAGLLVGSVAGRARWLAAVAAVLLPLTLLAVTLEDLGIHLRDGVDSRLLVVNDTSELDGPLSIGAGELTIDLTQAALTDGMVLEARVGAGELTVLVPDGTGLEGEVRVEVGELGVLGDRSSGVGVRREVQVAPAAGAPTVVLDLRVGAGVIAVERSVDLTDDLGDDVFDEDDAFDEGPTFDEDAVSDEDAMFDEDVTTEEVQP
jgi:hypothetical protein